MTKILIIRLSSLGDIIHVYPMIYDIKQHIKNCQIDWLVDNSFYELVKCNYMIDNVIAIPLRSWKKNKLSIISEFKVWKKNLPIEQYDYIIDVQGLIKSAFLTKFFNGPTYGYGFSTAKEKLACLFYQNKINIKNNFIVTKHRLLAAQIFGYNIDVNKVNFGINSHTKNLINLNKEVTNNNQTNVIFGVHLYNNLNISSINGVNNSICDTDAKNLNLSQLKYTKPYIMCFCMASKDSKKYALSNWIKLFTYLIKTYNYKIIITFGNIIEKNEVIQFKHHMANSENIIIPENTYSYHELHNLINNAIFIFGVDTGLTHLANALNKNMIALFVDTDPADTGIWQTKNAINMGNKNNPPLVEDIIFQFEQISHA
jgi:heptosyltransferase-1